MKDCDNCVHFFSCDYDDSVCMIDELKDRWLKLLVTISVLKYACYCTGKLNVNL